MKEMNWLEYDDLINRLLYTEEGYAGERLRDALDVAYGLMNADETIVIGKRAETTSIKNPENLKRALEWTEKIRREALKEIKAGNGSDELDYVYWRTLLLEAPYIFDSYCRYMEKDREPRKRFYEPRRKQLLPVAKALQDLADNKLDILCISEPPGVGKTTIALFFLTWIEGRNPELSVLGGSHSNSFLRGVYDEICRILDPRGEYKYADVFPNAPVVNTNAKDMRIDLQRRKRFESFEFSSVGSGNAGKVRASNLLYCDDLVDGIETAMSIDRLDKLYSQYVTDLKQRMIGDAKELIIATRWSVHDVIGRLEQQYEGNERARFIRFAALDENDESNFDYPYNLGFTTEFYHNQRNLMDDVSWRALYMNEPIEREGILYDNDELRRFFDLPERAPDAIIAVCDSKEQGNDFCAMPIVYQYGQDFYIADWICDNGKPEIIRERIISALCKHDVQLLRVESNRGGTIFAKEIQDGLKAKGSHCKVTTKWNQTNKETRILVASAWVKEHCLFLDESIYIRERKEYRIAMQQLTGYAMSGKNKHDDVPDSLADLENFVNSFATSRVEIAKRTF